MKLILTNFKSHKNFTIEFTEGKKILLSGNSGAGKFLIKEEFILGQILKFVPLKNEKSKMFRS